MNSNSAALRFRDFCEALKAGEKSRIKRPTMCFAGWKKAVGCFPMKKKIPNFPALLSGVEACDSLSAGILGVE